MRPSYFLAKILGFLRAGYPEDTPGADRVPLFSLMQRRLSDDEVLLLATELRASSERPIDGTRIGTAIMKLTDQMPSSADTDRVKQRLSAGGWGSPD